MIHPGPSDPSVVSCRDDESFLPPGKAIIPSFSLIIYLPGIHRVQQKIVTTNGNQSHAACFQGKLAYLLSRLEASGIEPVPLAFKASVMATAPVVLHYTIGGSQM